MQSLPDLHQLSSAQKDELILHLYTQVQALSARLLELEQRASLNSTNSSKPPSSDGLRKPNPKSLRETGLHPNGGQLGHPGNTLRQIEHVDVVVEHKSAQQQCPVCSGELMRHEVIERRQVIDLPPMKAHVTEHRLMRSRCSCGCMPQDVWHEGVWPQGVNAPAQYGAGVKALVVSLSQQHLVPLGRVCEVMQDAFGIGITQASVLAFNDQAAQALAPVVQDIGQALQAAPVVHADESGIRIKKATYWLHCAVNGGLTWLGVHAKRGAVAFAEFGLLGGVRGTLVHDGLISYKSFDCTHSLCNAHHLRELQAAHEQDCAFDSWAKDMQTLLVQANKEVGQTKEVLPNDRQQHYLAQWDVLLKRGLEFNPERTNDSQRRNAKQSKTHNLLCRLSKYTDEVWRFMTEAGVPFTNNLAEQAIRMCKVKQKVSGCFRTMQGAQTFCTIRAYLATMKKQNANLLDCLRSVFAGNTIQPRLT
jgi:transposase